MKGRKTDKSDDDGAGEKTQDTSGFEAARTALAAFSSFARKATADGQKSPKSAKSGRGKPGPDKFVSDKSAADKIIAPANTAATKPASPAPLTPSHPAPRPKLASLHTAPNPQNSPQKPDQSTGTADTATSKPEKPAEATAPAKQNQPSGNAVTRLPTSASAGDPKVGSIKTSVPLKSLPLHKLDSENIFAKIAGFSAAHAWQVIIGFVIMALLATGLTAWKLQIDTDPERMISGDLPFRRAFHDLTKSFPQLDQTFAIVVDTPDGERGRDIARQLRIAFDKQPDLFSDVYAPGTSEFFDTYGLLYLPPDDVKRAVRQIGEAEPLLKTLAERPNLSGFAGLIASLGNVAAAKGLPPSFAVFLNETGVTVEGEVKRNPHEFDWSRLALHEREMGALRWYVFVKPKLDYAALDPAEAAMREAKRIINSPRFSALKDVTVRLTGEAAMNAEEFEAVTNGAAIAGIASFIIVTIVIGFGMPMIRLIIPALVMLILGFLLNAGFATLAIGSLNMISVAFAVLFIGLGIDYAVHVILRYWEFARLGFDKQNAAINACKRAGPALGVCTITTALAFLAFVPTDFNGMSQLGIIAAAGIVIAYIAAMTLIPAVLVLLPLKPKTKPKSAASSKYQHRLKGAWYQLRLATSIFTILVAIAGCVLLPKVSFDGDPVNLKDPDSAAVVTFRDLLVNDPGEAYAAHLMVDDKTEAQRIGKELAALPEVARVRSIENFIPGQQGDKLGYLAKLRGTIPQQVATSSHLPIGLRRASIESLKSDLLIIANSEKSDAKVREAANRLRSVLLVLDSKGQVSEGRLSQLETSLFAGLPQTILRLNKLAEAVPITEANIDTATRDRYVASDGRWRLEIVPKGDLRNEHQLRQFVKAITSVSGNVTGAPVEIAGAADVVANSMLIATLSAFGILLVILVVMLRRIDDVILVLLPLVIAALLLIAYTVIFHSPFNFANVIVLPLLMGLGVDAAVHYVMRAREEGAADAVVETSTPRAVVIAALTTIGSFGTLWLSKHKGMSSMGELLTIAIIITLICTTIVLPQLIAWSDGLKTYFTKQRRQP